MWGVLIKTLYARVEIAVQYVETEHFTSTKDIWQDTITESEAAVVCWLILSVGYFWMTFIMQMHLKLNKGSHIETRCILEEIVVSASKQWTARYCVCVDGGASKYERNNCRAPTQEFTIWKTWFWTFQMFMSYKVRNSSLTFRSNKPLLLPCTCCWKRSIAHVRGVDGLLETLYSMRRTLLKKWKCPSLMISRGHCSAGDHEAWTWWSPEDIVQLVVLQFSEIDGKDNFLSHSYNKLLLPFYYHICSLNWDSIHFFYLTPIIIQSIHRIWIISTFFVFNPFDGENV
jgi:hypothetical protein